MPRKVSRVRALVSFNEVRKGDVAELEVDARVRAWVAAGLVEVLDGETAAGPGTADAPVARRRAKRAGNGSPSGDEQGEGFGAGGYGTSEGVDQG